MPQPLEAKLRRLRELNAKAEKLKVDVNRLWRRFPPLPGSYVGVGIGVPEGDPQLTRTVTTPEHFPCKRLFLDCEPPIYTVYIDSCKRYSLGSIVSDTFMEGKTFTFDCTTHLPANGYSCASGDLDFSVGSRYEFVAVGDDAVTYIGNDNVCDIDDETSTGVDSIALSFQDYFAPAPWSPYYVITLRTLYKSVTTPEGVVKKPVYDVLTQGSFGGGAFEADEIKRTGYPSDEQGSFQDGCDPGPLEVGESRTFSSKVVSGAGTFKALEVTLTRVA